MELKGWGKRKDSKDFNFAKGKETEKPKYDSTFSFQENDLLLAAELGKALLDKNEELKKNHEKLNEEYLAKIEVSTIF